MYSLDTANVSPRRLWKYPLWPEIVSLLFGWLAYTRTPSNDTLKGSGVSIEPGLIEHNAGCSLCKKHTLLSVIFTPSGHLLKGVKLYLIKGMAEQILTQGWRPIVTFITWPLALWPYEAITVQSMVLCNGKCTKWPSPCSEDATN